MTEHQTNRKAMLQANLNPNKRPNDKSPIFEGTIQLPDEAHARALKLWVHRDRNGNTMFVGFAPDNALNQIERLANNLPVVTNTKDLAHAQTTGHQFVVDPYDLIILTNTRKTDGNSKWPDWKGYYNPGPSGPLLRVSLWARTDSDGRAKLTGALHPHEMSLHRDKAGADAPTLPVVVIHEQAFYRDDVRLELRAVDDPAIIIPLDDLEAQDGSLLYGLDDPPTPEPARYQAGEGTRTPLVTRPRKRSRSR
ncbi:MAG: hypothetical protein ABL907_25160 [Hyphomicrobium sp.]